MRWCLGVVCGRELQRVARSKSFGFAAYLIAGYGTDRQTFHKPDVGNSSAVRSLDSANTEGRNGATQTCKTCISYLSIS